MRKEHVRYMELQKAMKSWQKIYIDDAICEFGGFSMLHIKLITMIFSTTKPSADLNLPRITCYK